MPDQRPPLQAGEPVPDFNLPAANRDGALGLADLRGRPFLIGFYRGLHCPFCRRQVVQLGAVQPLLAQLGIETLAVINTPLDRARLYFRHRPTPVTLLSDPECRTHHAFGVPFGVFQPEDSPEPASWPYRSTMAQFMAARVNPDGLFEQPTQPMEANFVLNARDGFQMEPADEAILAAHGTQLVGHFLVDGSGVVRWAHIEALHSPNDLTILPTAEQIVAAARALAA